MTKEKNSKKITKNMLIGEVAMRWPDAAAVMFEYGLHCVGCHIAAMETIEDGAKAHGLSDAQINEMIEKMNVVLKKCNEKTK